jgi:hypothetical protein
MGNQMPKIEKKILFDAHRPQDSFRACLDIDGQVSSTVSTHQRRTFNEIGTTACFQTDQVVYLYPICYKALEELVYSNSDDNRYEPKM